MWDDFEEIVWRLDELFLLGSQVELLILKAHGASGHPNRTVVKRAHQRVRGNLKLGLGKLFWEAPQLATASDGRLIIEIHHVGVTTFAALLINH